MVSVLFTILIMCLIFGLIWWVLGVIPLPQPFLRVAQVVVAVLFCIWLIYLLMPYAGFSHVPLR